MTAPVSAGASGVTEALTSREIEAIVACESVYGDPDVRAVCAAARRLHEAAALTRAPATGAVAWIKRESLAWLREHPEGIMQTSVFANVTDPNNEFAPLFAAAPSPAGQGDAAKQLAEYDIACDVLSRLIAGLHAQFPDIPECDGDNVEHDVLCGLSMYIDTIKKAPPLAAATADPEAACDRDYGPYPPDDAPDAQVLWCLHVLGSPVQDKAQAVADARIAATLRRLARAAATAGLTDAALALVNLVEGPGCIRWQDSTGFRFKDTTEWCAFYVATKRATRPPAAATQPWEAFDADLSLENTSRVPPDEEAAINAAATPNGEAEAARAFAKVYEPDEYEDAFKGRVQDANGKWVAATPSAGDGDHG